MTAMTAGLGRLGLTAAESFWYVLGCIAFGAMYSAKVPAKKALDEAGLVRMTEAEQFWYVLQCIAFGAGYFAKVPVKKALSEISQIPSTAYGQQLQQPGYGTAAQLGMGQHQLQDGYSEPLGHPQQLPPSHRRARHGDHGQQPW